MQYLRRFIIKCRHLHDELRTHKFNNFSRGRIGKYLEDSHVKLKHKREFREQMIKISAKFVCEAIRRPMSYSKRSMFVKTPISETLKDELLHFVKMKLLRYAFALKPSKSSLASILSDENGCTIKNPVGSSLTNNKMMRDAIDSCCKHMEIIVTSKPTKKRHPTTGVVTYSDLLTYMEANLPKNSMGYLPNMTELVHTYLRDEHNATLKTYLHDNAEASIVKSLTTTQRKRDVDRMIKKYDATVTNNKKLRSKLVTGAIATYEASEP